MEYKSLQNGYYRNSNVLQPAVEFSILIETVANQNVSDFFFFHLL